MPFNDFCSYLVLTMDLVSQKLANDTVACIKILVDVGCRSGVGLGLEGHHMISNITASASRY